MESEGSPVSAMIVVGGDELALRVVSELAATYRVTLVWERDPDLAERADTCGAAFIAIAGDERGALVRAEVAQARAIVALTDDDHRNLRIVLAARDLNASIRIVLRQFNRTLGRKIEANLRDCSVVSLSSHAAATYASVAIDPTCFYGVQFPDIDGPCVGFHRIDAATEQLVGLTIAQAQMRIAGRILERDGEVNLDSAAPLREGETLVVFRESKRGLRFGRASARVPRGRSRFDRLVRRELRRLDPVFRVTLVIALVVVLVGSAYFAVALRVDPIRALYFVLATMTTTGYGDLTPRATFADELAAMALMLAGLGFSGVFIAALASRFTRAQYIASQGIREITQRGHVVVCGAGNVGSRVIDDLLRLGVSVVVIETMPKVEIAERARDREFALLTGDATTDRTLDHCNIEEAAALIALTHGDTMNLEVALGARARNPHLPIVMRVQHENFAASVRRHFGIDHTYGTAALAAPVLAGLTTTPGIRGRVELGGLTFSLIEFTNDELPEAAAPDRILLAAANGGRVRLVNGRDDVSTGDVVLGLVRVT